MPLKLQQAVQDLSDHPEQLSVVLCLGDFIDGTFDEASSIPYLAQIVFIHARHLRLASIASLCQRPMHGSFAWLMSMCGTRGCS